MALNGVYEKIQAISIDRAVMEGAAADHHVVMGRLDVGWSDSAAGPRSSPDSVPGEGWWSSRGPWSTPGTRILSSSGRTGASSPSLHRTVG